MESTVEELGKLKYSLVLEISLEEIKPAYDAVYQELRQIRLNGFRPGKHPKGWLDKRFKTAMHTKAVDHVIPDYLEKALQKHSLKPATVPSIQEINFDRRSPLCTTIHFEIAPELLPLDYGKILLERKEIEEVTAKDIMEDFEDLLESEKVWTPREEDAQAEGGDLVTICYEGTIDGGNSLGAKNDELSFKIGGFDFTEFHSVVTGMRKGEEKEAEIELSEMFEENEGKNAQIKISLLELSTGRLPELNEDFFKKFDVADEEELKKNIGESIKFNRTNELQSEYRIAVRSQLSDLYDEFDLPESLLEFEHKQVDQTLEKASDLSEDEKEKERQERYEEAKMDLRMKFIMESVNKHEQVGIDENQVAREFISFAQVVRQSAEEFIQTPLGRNMYERIVHRKQSDAILDRIVARVFGDPIEESADETHDHVHSHHHDHDHNHSSFLIPNS